MTTSPKGNAQRAGDRKNTERQPRIRIRLRRKIDLSEPYENGLATALSLSRISHSGNEDENAEEVTKVFRKLYEAAKGRQIWTVIGPISIAPAVAPWLKEAPLSFETQEDLFEFIANLNGAPAGDSADNR